MLVVYLLREQSYGKGGCWKMKQICWFCTLFKQQQQDTQHNHTTRVWCTFFYFLMIRVRASFTLSSESRTNKGKSYNVFFVSAEFWTWKVMVLNSRHWSLVNTLGSWSGASLLLMILEEVSWNVLLLQNLQKFDHRDCGNFCLNPCLMLIFQCDYLLFPATYNLFCGMRGN